VVTVAELVEWCLKNDLGARIEEYAREIARSSVLLGLDEQIAMLVGKVNYDRKKMARGWGMIDSLILATAVSYNLNIITGDSHFRDLPNAKML
jgi:predicted nucleic acid-binding protein